MTLPPPSLELAAYLAAFSLGAFLVALLAFFLRKNRLLIGMGCATFFLSALSFRVFFPILAQNKIVPDWFFADGAGVTFLYLAAFLLGAASVAIGLYRLRRR